MRVYVPSTLAALERILGERGLGPGPLTAHAVTPALRESYASGDAEELEYAAMSEAARESLRLLAAAPEAPSRRVVLAADVPDTVVKNDADGRSTVVITAPVSLDDIVAAHVDDATAEADIRAARSALPAADAGDDDALFTVDGAEGHELMWYASQELAFLI